MVILHPLYLRPVNVELFVPMIPLIFHVHPIFMIHQVTCVIAKIRTIVHKHVNITRSRRIQPHLRVTC
jgi:hypothetical protein